MCLTSYYVQLKEHNFYGTKHFSDIKRLTDLILRNGYPYLAINLLLKNMYLYILCRSF